MANKEDWIGRVGSEWARHEGALERLLGPAAAAGLDALSARPGEHVLDLGCGSGASTQTIADAVGSTGLVVGLDVSPDLLALARAKVSGHSNVEMRLEDAQTAALGEQKFDALFSRFGSMFFDEPVVALANVRRSVKAGGRAVFVA